MARILVVGVGDVGGHLARELAKAGHEVWGIRRSDKSVGEGVQLIQADVADMETLQDLPKDLDILVYSVAAPAFTREGYRSEEHTSELQSRPHLVCRLLLEKKK